ncbi:MAG: NAD-dependent epimerase/dehydratase family protein [Acidimicrobiales bacterium]|jgi:NAD dependent epimerase/dehydratase family enzyme|nr:NAD-dependent epimerase/dehydratase family protein [Acidimicrobiales bacterium]
MRIALFGGSGFLGRALATQLAASGDRPLVIARSDPHLPGVDFVAWDGQTLGSWVDALRDITHVVHLAGKRVDCRPTEANLQQLIDSREGTVVIAAAGFERAGLQPDVWVQLSSLARYGDVPDGRVDKNTRLPLDGIRQHVEVCRRSEAAYRSVTDDVDRRVLLRPGIAIGGADDPATAQLIRLIRWGLGGRRPSVGVVDRGRGSLRRAEPGAR